LHKREEKERKMLRFKDGDPIDFSRDLLRNALSRSVEESVEKVLDAEPEAITS